MVIWCAADRQEGGPPLWTGVVVEAPRHLREECLRAYACRLRWRNAISVQRTADGCHHGWG